jgi:hypothetical protein
VGEHLDHLPVQVVLVEVEMEYNPELVEMEPLILAEAEEED